MLIRNSAPVFGANRHPYQEPGEWQFTIASRNLVSNDHYNGTAEQVQRQTLQNYVTNKQNLVDVGRQPRGQWSTGVDVRDAVRQFVVGVARSRVSATGTAS